MKRTAAALMICLWTLGAHAVQPVYRCGSVYSQTPCPQGRVVEATDPRSGAQRAEARRVAADERKLAADMRRDRLAEQAALKPAGAGSLSAPAPAKAASSSGRGQTKRKKRNSAQPGVTPDFIAADPGSKKQNARK